MDAAIMKQDIQARRDAVDMVKFSGSMLFCLLLVTQPTLCRRWAGDALADWALHVVPSLLPFLMALPRLAGPQAAAVYRSLLGWAMRPFGLPGETAGVAVVGLLAGSPASAAALRMQAGGLDRNSSARLAILSAGAGPVFYMSFVARLAGSLQAGRMMYLCQVFSGVITAWLMKMAYRSEKSLPALQAEWTESADPVMGAVGQILHIGGCMALFAILGQAAGLYLGEWARTPVMAVMEMSGGVRAISQMKMDEAWRLALMGGCCCFGGVSILIQSLRHLKPAGVPTGPYVCARGIHAALDALLIRLWCFLML